MAARRNLQCLSNLVRAISRLGESNSEGNDENTDDTSVEATIRSLSPSVNGQAAPNQSTPSQENRQSGSNQNETRVVGAPDRRLTEASERFVANKRYGGKKRSRSGKNAANKKPKCSELRTTLKDVILLPSPKQQKSSPRNNKGSAIFPWFYVNV